MDKIIVILSHWNIDMHYVPSSKYPSVSNNTQSQFGVLPATCKFTFKTSNQ